MRVLSRIFCAICFAVGLVFYAGGASAAETSCDNGMTYYEDARDCCYAYYNKECITELGDWRALLDELGCEGGYVDSNGRVQCCPDGTIIDDKYFMCTCEDEREVFNTETGRCERAVSETCASGYYYDSARGTCMQCMAGYYCPGDNNIYQCTGRTKYSAAGASACSTVSSGRYTTGCTGNNGCTGQAVCSAGYYCLNGVNTTCAIGSYTNTTGRTACTACGAGTTTSAAGATSCGATCSNNANVSTWLTPSWSANTVTNLCSISTCNSGYNNVSNACVASYTVTLRPGLGISSAGTTTIYVSGGRYYRDSAHTQQMTTSTNPITLPQRTSYTFSNYSANAGAGGSYFSMIDANGYITSDAISNVASITSNNVNVYANWNYTGTTGTYSLSYWYGDSNPETIWYDYNNSGSFTIRNITDSFFGGAPTIYGTSTFGGWCVHNYYYLMPGDVYNGGYSSDLHARWCSTTGGHDNVIAWIPTMTELINMGFATDDTDARIKMCNNGYGGLNATVKCNTGYKMVASNDGSIRGTYTLNGEAVRVIANCSEGQLITSCTACTNTKPTNSHYSKSGDISGNCAWECDSGYVQSDQSCIAQSCVAITLNRNGGSGGTTTLYKLAGVTGWFSDSSCTTSVSSLTSRPTKSGSVYAGHYTAASSGTQYITAAGVLSTTWAPTVATTLYAHYSQCAAGEYQNGTVCTACPTGYTSNSGATSITSCYVTCPSGTRVASVGGVCTTPASTAYNGWFTPSSHTVYYGGISPVSYCMSNYVNITTNATYHKDTTQCKTLVGAGYYVKDANYVSRVKYIRMRSDNSSTGLDIAEIQALTPGGVNVLANVAPQSTNGITNPEIATDGAFDVGSVTQVAATREIKWEVSGGPDVASIRFLLGNGTYSGVYIDIMTETSDNYVNVFYADTLVGTNYSTYDQVLLTGIPVVCPAGKYSVDSTVVFGNTTACENVSAGYWTSGGGTSATPTGVQNGCLSGQTCGKCPTGWPNSAAGSDEITDCYSNTKSRAWTGSQTTCSNPDTTGCAGVTCGTCSNAACNYVAYVNAAGNADGNIKSGCETNNASCTKPVTGLTANTGYHTVSGNLESCPANSYTVAFNANGGSGSANPTSVTCTYDQDCTLAAQGTLSKTNATFAGWNSASDGSGDTYSESQSVQNLSSTNNDSITMYAIWTTSGCVAGKYLDSGSCISCPAGYSCAGGSASPVMCATNRYSTGGAASCSSCTNGLTTSSIADSRYHDEAADCGRVLHVGAYEIRLKSIPSTGTLSSLVPSPSLRFNYAGNANGRPDFYANMSTIASPMRVTSTGAISTAGSGDKFKTKYNNTNYYVCDDVTCVTQ